MSFVRKAASVIVGLSLVCALTPAAWAQPSSEDAGDSPAAPTVEADDASAPEADAEGEQPEGGEGLDGETAANEEPSNADGEEAVEPGEQDGQAGESGSDETDDAKDEAEPEVESNGRTLDNGWYCLSPIASSAVRVKVAKSSVSDGANVVLSSKASSHAQYFKLAYQNGWYTLRNGYSLKYLAVADAAANSGCNVVQRAKVTDAARWTIRKNPDGGWLLVNKATGCVLDLAKGSAEAGANVRASKSGSAKAAGFKLYRKRAFVKSGTYRINTPASKKARLGIKGASVGRNAAAVLSTKSSKNLSQKWKVVHLGGGVYKVVNAKSGRALHLKGASTASGTAIVQHTYKGAASQKWRIEPAGGGSYRIVSVKEPKISLSVGSAKTGVTLRARTNAVSRSQRFSFSKTTYRMSKSGLLNSISVVSGGSGIKTFNGGTISYSRPSGKHLRKAVDKVSSRGWLTFMVMDLNTGAGFSYHATSKHFCASTIKGPYVAAINKYQRSRVTASVRSTMSDTIRVSSNSGYASLRAQFGASPMNSMMGYTGCGDMSASVHYQDLSPKQLGRLWIGNYWYFFKDTNANSKWCRNLYTAPLMSQVHESLGGTYKTYTKPGWMTSAGSYGKGVVNDAGLVAKKGHPYLIVVMSEDRYHLDEVCDLIRAIDEVHTDMFA